MSGARGPGETAPPVVENVLYTSNLRVRLADPLNRLTPSAGSGTSSSAEGTVVTTGGDHPPKEAKSLVIPCAQGAASSSGSVAMDVKEESKAEPDSTPHVGGLAKITPEPDTVVEDDRHDDVKVEP